MKRRPGDPKGPPAGMGLAGLILVMPRHEGVRGGLQGFGILQEPCEVVERIDA